ncbi:hypothetical protein ARMGADRAFT_573340 [Armillaria gallica]|uniref:Uncharacterized protein n=1 Tax=Armillaria gallica TaxID=47427 RepID=A0A2H3E3M6_ARMGA|nr:hypothetical protein ARMGADRAFT_573340 [Armillaria gallica]
MIDLGTKDRKRVANSERRSGTRPFSSYSQPVLRLPPFHCVDGDSRPLRRGFVHGRCRGTGKGVIDVVLDDGGRRKESFDRNLDRRLHPTANMRTHTMPPSAPHLDAYANNSSSSCLVRFLTAAIPQLCIPNGGHS